MKVESKIAIESEFDDICNSFLNVDPDIQEIILFGSIETRKEVSKTKSYLY